MFCFVGRNPFSWYNLLKNEIETYFTVYSYSMSVKCASVSYVLMCRSVRDALITIVKAYNFRLSMGGLDGVMKSQLSN